MRALRLLLAGLVVSASAFSFTHVPLRATRRTSSTVAPAVARVPHRPAHSASRLAPVHMGLFGLGAPELAVIGLVVLFVLGPDKLKELARDAGKALPEIKEVTADALGEFKEASVEAAKAAKDASAPALQELKEAATPVLSEFKDVALKEAKEVAKEFKEGANEAEVPTGAATPSADAITPKEKDNTQA